MIQPTHPLEVTNALLRAIIVLLTIGPPAPEKREAFLASLGIGLTGGDSPEKPPSPESEIVQFPDRGDAR